MRKLFIAALLAATLGTSAFATEGNKVNVFTKNNFEAQFQNASNVKWSEGKGYTKATFAINDKKMEAFYNQNGEMIGTSIAVTLDELPVNAKRSLAKKCEGFTVKEAIRFEGTEDSSYYVSAENEKGTVIFKVEENGYISVKKM